MVRNSRSVKIGRYVRDTIQDAPLLSGFAEQCDRKLVYDTALRAEKQAILAEKDGNAREWASLT